MRAASSFWETWAPGSSWTRAQAETGDRPASAAATFARSSQPASVSITSAHNSSARDAYS